MLGITLHFLFISGAAISFDNSVASFDDNRTLFDGITLPSPVFRFGGLTGIVKVRW